jgi:hypothetical protein
VPTIPKFLGNLCTAQAGLGRASGVYLNKLAPGAFSLVREFAQEGTPTSIVDGLGQHPAGKPFNVQTLDDDHAVIIHQHPTSFVMKIGTLVLDTRVLPLQHGNGFPASVRSLIFATCDCALCYTQAALGIPVEAWIGNLGTIAEGCEGRQPHVNANRRDRCRQQIKLTLDGEDDEPTASLPLDRNGFDLSLYGAVQLDLDFTYTLNSHQLVFESTAIAEGRKGQAIISTTRFEARESSFHPAFYSTEECLESLVHTMQHILAAREVCQGETSIGPHCFELIRLIVVVDRLPTNTVCPDTLFQSGVVQVAGFTELLTQRGGLLSVGVYSVFEGLAHLLTFLVFNVLLDSRSGHRADTAGEIASVPQCRDSVLGISIHKSIIPPAVIYRQGRKDRCDSSAA